MENTMKAEQLELLVDQDSDAPPVGRGLLEGERLARFMTAGQALLTVENTKTGTHYTYRLERAKLRPGQDPDSAPVFVSVLVGQHNDDRRSYRYVGTLWSDGPLSFRYGGAKAKLAATAPSVKGIEWLVGRVQAGRAIPAPMRVWHEGKCGRCGRTLTVPTSIESGLGPVCESRGR